MQKPPAPRARLDEQLDERLGDGLARGDGNDAASRRIRADTELERAEHGRAIEAVASESLGTREGYAETLQLLGRAGQRDLRCEGLVQGGTDIDFAQTQRPCP